MTAFTYNVGDILRLKQTLINEPAGTLCLVYRLLGDENNLFKSMSVITRNGVNLGEFADPHELEFFEFVRHLETEINFKTVLQLRWEIDDNLGELITETAPESELELDDDDDNEIASLDGESFTKNSLMDYARGNMALYNVLYSTCGWIHPEQMIRDLIANGEVEDRGNMYGYKNEL